MVLVQRERDHVILYVLTPTYYNLDTHTQLSWRSHIQDLVKGGYMRVPISLIILSMLILLLGFITTEAKGARKTAADLIFNGAEIEKREEAKVRVKDVDIKSIVDLDNLWEKDNEDTELWIRLVRGILRSRQHKLVNGKKVIKWEACGKRVPEEEYYERAKTWAISYVKSLEEVEKQTGVKVNPWGAFATSANEGGFNECSLNYSARRWASKHVGREWTVETWKGKTAGRWVDKKVVPRFRLTYDKETVWKIINHKDYAKGSVIITTKYGQKKKVRMSNKFDGGPYQLRFSVKTIDRERFDYLMSIHPGVYLGVKELARRALHAQKVYKLDTPHKYPWMYWPGYASAHISNKYERKIRSVARWLGARKGEI